MMKFGWMIFFLVGSAAYSQQSGGTITGVITSSDDASPLVGATVIIQNTTLGTSSDANGKFVLKNIPEGKYDVVASMVGFHRKVVERVEVKSNEETSLLIQLVLSPIQTDVVVVTSNKREQILEEVPVSMSIVNAQLLESRSTIAVDDALRYVPGVNVTQSQVNIRGSTGYSRGVGSRVLLLIDGLPLLAGDTGEPIFESVPVFQIDRIEVVKGAGSALYGTSALGGVINVLTKEVPEHPETRWRLYSKVYDAPPYERWKWSDKLRALNAQYISHSERIGDVSFILAGSRLFDDSYREADWTRRYNGYGKIKYDMSPFLSLAVSSNVLWQHRGDYIWWKDLKNALRPADSQLNFSVTSLRINSSVLFKHFVNEKFTYEVKAIHYHGNWREDSLNVTLANESTSDVVSMEVQANYSLDELNIMTMGVAVNSDNVSSDIFGTHGGYGGAVYVQDELQLSKRLMATLGARLDYQQVASLPSNQQINPKLGLRYQADDQTSFRASVGRGFRAPSIAELFVSTNVTTSTVAIVPSPELKAEHSWSFEIGGTENFDENAVWDVALFQSDFSDLIEAGVEFDSTRNSPVIRFRNVTQARIQGCESNIRTVFFDQLLSLDLNYTYTWPYDVNKRSVLRFRPRHVASVNTVVSYKEYTFGADMRYISRIDAIDDDLVRLAPIIDGKLRVPIYIADVRASGLFHEFGFPLKINLHVNNLFRYSYVELIGNLAPLRSFVLSVEGVF
jgi:iron complex outermembrane receptor protein